MVGGVVETEKGEVRGVTVLLRCCSFECMK